MLALTLKDVAGMCGGRLSDADPDAVVRAVVTDSRRIDAGALFVALPGERTDGHAFVRHAVAGGAVAAIVRADADTDGPVIRVAEPAVALLDLAEAVRARLAATVIAITGSSGKTGTKDLIRAACGSTRRTVASEASYNNEIGVPLTLLAAEEDTEVLVVEVGSRGIGHIAALMSVVRPDISVVTNVGSAHVGMFGSIENTAIAKGELVEALPAEGTAVLAADDPLVRAMAARTRAQVVLAGRREDADVRAVGVVLDEHACARFEIVAGDERAQVSLQIPGEHTVTNATLAIAAAAAVGVPLAEAAAGVSACAPARWRMEVIETPRGIRILNDAYNANPESMTAALKTLAAMGRGGSRPTWAVVGHMAELGPAETEEHDRIGRLAVRLGVTHLVTVGADARAIHEAARLEGMFGGEARFAPDVDAAAEIVANEAEDDAVVLVKASRATGLERVVERLREALS